MLAPNAVLELYGLQSSPFARELILIQGAFALTLTAVLLGIDDAKTVRNAIALALGSTVIVLLRYGPHLRPIYYVWGVMHAISLGVFVLDKKRE